MAPYSRIIVMHLTILIGAFALGIFSFLLGDFAIHSLAGVWVLFKIIVDLQAHWKAHVARENQADQERESFMSPGNEDSE